MVTSCPRYRNSDGPENHLGLYNDNTWNKSQRYGGFAFVGTGFIIIVASIFVPGIYNLLVLFLTLMFGLVLSIILSYKVYKEEKAKEKTTS